MASSLPMLASVDGVSARVRAVLGVTRAEPRARDSIIPPPSSTAARASRSCRGTSAGRLGNERGDYNVCCVRVSVEARTFRRARFPRSRRVGSAACRIRLFCRILTAWSMYRRKDDLAVRGLGDLVGNQGHAVAPDRSHHVAPIAQANQDVLLLACDVGNMGAHANAARDLREPVQGHIVGVGMAVLAASVCIRCAAHHQANIGEGGCVPSVYPRVSEIGYVVGESGLGVDVVIVPGSSRSAGRWCRA